MNHKKYQSDLKKLIKLGDKLYSAMIIECEQKQKSNLISVIDKYQTWYSESIVIIKFLIPDRLNDFIEYYKPKKRGRLNAENYVMEDYLQSLEFVLWDKVVVDKSAAISKFKQQMSILKACDNTLNSSLFRIQQLLWADIFDSELDAAIELSKKGFYRASGVIAGVVLEAHLSQICKNHNLKIGKTDPSINDYNDQLKNNNIISIDIFRHIQRLGDLRNKCSHNKKQEPTQEDVNDLICGIEKIIKTTF